MADNVYFETGDTIDEASLAGAFDRPQLTDYVASGLGLTADYGANTVDVASGRAFIGGYTVEADARTGVSLTDSTVNYVYLEIDTSVDESVSITVNTTGSDPANPSLLLGSVDTGSESTTEENRTPDFDGDHSGTFDGELVSTTGTHSGDVDGSLTSTSGTHSGTVDGTLSGVTGSAGAIDIGTANNADGDQRAYTAGATVVYDGTTVVALDRFGARISTGTHGGGGGTNDDSTVIQAAIDHVESNYGPNPRVNVVPNGAYIRLTSEIDVKQNITLDISGAQVLFGSDHNGFFLDQGTTLIAHGAIIRPEVVSGYTSDAIVLDSSRTSTGGGDYFFEDKSHVVISGYPLIYGTNGEGNMLALRANPNRIDAGLFAEVMTNGGAAGVLFDTTGSYINANQIRGQFRNADANILHDGGNNAASSHVRGTIGYGDYGIRNTTSSEGSIRFLGEFRDPQSFNTAVTDGPGIRCDQPGDEEKTVAYTSNADLLRGGHALVDASGDPVTVTLPQADLRTRVLVKKTDSSANAVTVQQDASGESIDGSSSISLPDQFDAVEVKSDGSVWHIVADNR